MSDDKQFDKQDLVQRLREMAKEWNPGDPRAADYAWHEYQTLIEAADELSKAFRPVAVGDDGWSEWQNPIMKGYRMKCCDCGLVHEVEFRIGEVTHREGDEWTGELVPEDKYRVQMRMKRQWNAV